MGKQRKTTIEGTYGNVTFYKLKNGRYYRRAKSSLNKKRVTTDPAFAPLMNEAALMATASPIASQIHKQLRKVKNGRQRYQRLVGEVKALLKEEMPLDEIVALVIKNNEKKRK
jgi:hypothetical protein